MAGGRAIGATVGGRIDLLGDSHGTRACRMLAQIACASCLLEPMTPAHMDLVVTIVLPVIIDVVPGHLGNLHARVRCRCCPESISPVETLGA